MSKRDFFPILGALKRGGDYALGDTYERPGFRPKSPPPAEWRIFGVFRGLGSEGWRLGAEPNFRADVHRRLRRITWPSMSSQGGLESYWMRTCCFRNIFLMFFLKHIHGIMELRFLSWSKWGRLVPESSCGGFFLENCCQFHFPLRVKAPLCKDFSV